MPRLSTNLAHAVLHVRQGTVDRITPMDARLAALSIEADVCPDVYRALARLCADGAGPTRFVIVSIADLLPPELEFFALAKRARRELALYAYGGRADDPHASQAFESAGAREASDEALRAIAEALRPETAPRRAASTDRPEVVESDADVLGADDVDETGGEAVAPHAETADEESAGEEDDAHDEALAADDDPVAPVPVPWMRRDKAPTRIAPSGPARTDETPARPGFEAGPRVRAAEGGAVSADRSKPLLTEEELRALLADDGEDEADEHDEASSPHAAPDPGAHP